MSLFNLNPLTVAAIGDGSAITLTAPTDDIAGLTTYVSGDGNANGILDRTEGWVYTATYTITDSDPSQLRNTVTVQGFDRDGDVITATDTHLTLVSPVPGPGDIFLPIIFKD